MLALLSWYTAALLALLYPFIHECMLCVVVPCQYCNFGAKFSLIEHASGQQHARAMT